MAELTGDARIRDLKRRLELDPSSRLFVTLAEEYRRSGLLPEALSTLQKGLLAHPGYLSAHVALGRAYLEAGQITESIATFNKVLATDPGNLVSAKSLADIYMSRGESVEAIKKYKLYRALSGDRTVDEIVERLQMELAPPAPSSRQTGTPALPPPPTFFDGKPKGPIRTSREIRFTGSTRPEIGEGTEIKPLHFELDDSAADHRSRGPELPMVLSRDVPFPTAERPTAPNAPPRSKPAGPVAVPAAAPSISAAVSPELSAAPFPVGVPDSDDESTRVMRISDVLGSAEPEIPPRSPAATAGHRGLGTPPEALAAAADSRETTPGPSGVPQPSSASAASTASIPPRAPVEAPSALPVVVPAAAGESQGRALGDLYFAQGHFAEALAIYDDLVAANPFDAELKRLRRDAEARLLPAASSPGLAGSDAGLSRRLAKVRALKRWLAVVQTG